MMCSTSLSTFYFKHISGLLIGIDTNYNGFITFSESFEEVI